MTGNMVAGTGNKSGSRFHSSWLLNLCFDEMRDGGGLR